MAENDAFKMHTGRLLSLQAQAGPWLEALAAGLSHLPPGRCMSANTPQGTVQWLRLGHEEWWCWQDQGGDTAPLLQAVAQAAGAEPHACVDLSDAHPACVLVAAQALLSCGCELDFERLPQNFAGRTRLEAFTVVLARTPAGAWCLWADASLAQSLQQWLTRTQALLAEE